MLRDRYTFKYGKKAAAGIADAMLSIENVDTRNNTLYALCIINLTRIIDNLTVFSRGVNIRKSIKINFNKKEALAFHVAYKNNFFDTTDYLLTEIFTMIDRTI